MQIAEQPLDVRGQRRGAIAETLERVRAIAAEQGVNRPALEAIKEALVELALRPGLFPRDDFPAGRDREEFHPIYRLAEDPDHSFALYMSTADPGKKVPPHNHTTWAVIVGVDGEEENFFYERTDDGKAPGRAELRQVGHEVVRRGTGVCLMPEDIHHIQTGGERPTLHLHLYGLALEQLTGRIAFDTAEGTCRVFPISPNIVDAR